MRYKEIGVDEFIVLLLSAKKLNNFRFRLTVENDGVFGICSDKGFKLLDNSLINQNVAKFLFESNLKNVVFY